MEEYYNPDVYAKKLLALCANNQPVAYSNKTYIPATDTSSNTNITNTSLLEEDDRHECS